MMPAATHARRPGILGAYRVSKVSTSRAGGETIARPKRNAALSGWTQRGSVSDTGRPAACSARNLAHAAGPCAARSALIAREIMRFATDQQSPASLTAFGAAQAHGQRVGSAARKREWPAVTRGGGQDAFSGAAPGRESSSAANAFYASANTAGRGAA